LKGATQVVSALLCAEGGLGGCYPHLGKCFVNGDSGLPSEAVGQQLRLVEATPAAIPPTHWYVRDGFDIPEWLGCVEVSRESLGEKTGHSPFSAELEGAQKIAPTSFVRSQTTRKVKSSITRATCATQVNAGILQGILALPATSPFKRWELFLTRSTEDLELRCLSAAL